MFWRKWMVRGIVWGIVAIGAAGALAYQRWTNSNAVREQIIAKIGAIFPGAEVSVDSAHLSILGGIKLNGLRFCRKDDPEKHEFLQVPSAIFYHDKEKMLDGELALRKIELLRPRLRVRRNRDGTCNLQNLLRPASDSPPTALPAIVIHQGTLILEDHSDPTRAAMLEINDVGMTIINDPLPRVTIRGAATSELLGKLHVNGRLERESNEAFLSFKATQIALTPLLIARLPMALPAPVVDGLKVRATANVEGKISYHPSLPQPLYYDVQCEVKDGVVEHPQLPLAFDQVNMKLRCNNNDGLQLETLTARSGTTLLEASGMAQLSRPEQEFEVHVDLKHVMLGDGLANRLPKKIGDLHRLFQPVGPTAIHIDCAKHEGQWVALTSGKPSLVSLRPENVSLAFKDFPYPLERAVGSIDYNLLDTRVDIDLTAYASGRPVILKGHWTGEMENADVDFNVFAEDVPINDKLLHALQTDQLRVLHAFAQSFHAQGKLNVGAKIKHVPGGVFSNVFKLHFHDADICWDNFPYPLTNVSGTLEIYPKHWAIRQFQGWHNQGHVILNGESTPDSKGESHGIQLEISGENLDLNDHLHRALKPMKGLHDAWATFRPQGNLSFKAIVNRPSSDIRELDVKVIAMHASVKPAFFPYLIQDIGGEFRFHDNTLTIQNLRAKHAQTLIALNHGKVDLNTQGGGGYYADFTDLSAVGFQLDDEFIQAISSDKIRKAAQALHLTLDPDNPPVRLQTRLVISQPPETGKPPTVYWDGRLWASGARLTTGIEVSRATGEIACVGLANGAQLVGLKGNALLTEAVVQKQPFKAVTNEATKEVQKWIHLGFYTKKDAPDVLMVEANAPIFGGDVTGKIQMDLNSTLRYTLNLTASGINLAEFGRHNIGPNSKLTGIATGRLVLSGWGTGSDTIEANGDIKVGRGAHIYNLPALSEFLKALRLNLNDHTTFDEFSTVFNLQGTKMHIEKIDLLGNTISLLGKGELDLATKDVKLDVYPMWGRVDQLFPREVQQVPKMFSKSLMLVEVRGKLGMGPNDLKFQLKPLPIVVDPLRMMREQFLRLPGLGEMNGTTGGTGDTGKDR